MNNFKDPPRLICSPASSMLLLVVKLADLCCLAAGKVTWKQFHRSRVRLRWCLRCWSNYHSFLAGAMLVFHLTGAEKIFSAYE